MPYSENQLKSPGLSIKAVLQNASKTVLYELLSTSIIDMVNYFESESISDEKLGVIASKILDPVELFQNEEKRKFIVNSIPDQKVQELAERLGIKSDNICTSHICNVTNNSNAFSIMLEFFGVSDEEKLTTNFSKDIKSIEPKYGLFDHQRDVAQRVILSLNRNLNKTLLHMPTGAGKTRTAMHVVSSHLKNNEETVVIWLAQNAELLEQAADEFETAWKILGNREVEIYRFWGNHQPNLENAKDGIIVAGLKKLSEFSKRNSNKMLSLSDKASLTVIDEAHQAIAPTYASVIDDLYTKRPKNKLLGLTATPGRSLLYIEEDMKLADFFDREKVSLEIEGYDNPVEFLINEGYLARPIFRRLMSNSKLQSSAGESYESETNVDISDNILEKLGDEVERNCQIVEAVEDLLIRHNRVIVFAPSVNSARSIEIILKIRNHEVYLVLGESKKVLRERMIRTFRSRGSNPIVMINFGVLTTGFDAPNVSAAVIARPTKSLVLYSQMVGRATRGIKAGGNDKSEIVTIIDTELPGFSSMEESYCFWEEIWRSKNESE